MRYTLLTFMTLFLISCGGEDSGWATEDMLVEPSPYAAGEKVYISNCASCHQKTGDGLEGAFPPLAQSDYLLADKERAIQIAANGMDGAIVVNGVEYNALMSSQGLTNEEVKDVVNYILNSWGNDGGEVTLSEVESALSK
ncbi:MAG: c-type cytochrome [Crocinitomicaceae bacterium]